jgi:hypothetical protein
MCGPMCAICNSNVVAALTVTAHTLSCVVLLCVMFVWTGPVWRQCAADQQCCQPARLHGTRDRLWAGAQPGRQSSHCAGALRDHHTHGEWAHGWLVGALLACFKFVFCWCASLPAVCVCPQFIAGHAGPGWRLFIAIANACDHFCVCCCCVQAPETIRDGELSIACDVYAWGVLLWEMITGASHSNTGC